MHLSLRNRGIGMMFFLPRVAAYKNRMPELLPYWYPVVAGRGSRFEPFDFVEPASPARADRARGIGILRRAKVVW